MLCRWQNESFTSITVCINFFCYEKYCKQIIFNGLLVHSIVAALGVYFYWIGF